MTDKKTVLDDDILDLVMGGTSLYEGADGLDRDSWFVRLVRRRMPNGGPTRMPTWCSYAIPTRS